MAKPASGSTLDTGHALYTSLSHVWAILESSGTTTADSKGGITGTLAGTVAFGSDGTGPYLVTTSGTGKLTLASTVTLSSSWSIAWAATNTGNDNNGMMAGSGSSAGYLWEEGGTAIFYRPSSGGDVSFTTDTSQTAEADRVLTHDGSGTYKLYKDGTLVNTVTGAGSASWAIDRLMSGFSGDTFSLVGKLRYFYTWSGRVLTLTEAGNIHTDPYNFFSSGGPGLSVGTLSITAHSAVTVSLAIATTSGGTSPYSTQFKVAPDVAGSPGSYTSFGSPVSGATPTQLVTSLAPNTKYWFKGTVTDSAGSPATADTNEISQTTDPTPDFSFGVISDSTSELSLGYGSRTVPQVIHDHLEKMGAIRNVTFVNAAESGTATGDWLPAGGRYLAARASFTAAGLSYVAVCLGLNDASAAVSATTFSSNLSSICSDLVSNGFRVILDYITPRNDNGTYDAAVTSYLAKIDLLVNGTTILRGDVLANTWIHANDQTSDGVHYTNIGAESVAVMRSWAYWNLALKVSPANPLSYFVPTPTTY